MDKVQARTMALFGYSVEEMPNAKRIPYMDYETPKGVTLTHLPADPYHMARYLKRGFKPVTGEVGKSNLPTPPNKEKATKKRGRKRINKGGSK